MKGKISITLPVPEGEDPADLSSLKGQWVTVLAFGKSIMAQIDEADALPWDVTQMSILATEGAPAVEGPETVEPVFHRKATHINCPHDPAGMHLENAMVCDGD